MVMYLTPAKIKATLAIIERRAAAGCRLIVVYHSPSLALLFVGLVVRRPGEPLRSSFTPEAMRALVARYGFGVVWDADIPTIGGAMSAEIAEGTRMMERLLIVIADRIS
jgi:hypothetical protein